MNKRRVIESARRVYGEVVRGRTRVQVVVEAGQDASTNPRFLLSPYRSGTTLFRYCLDSHADLAVPPETDFVTPLMTVLNDEASMTGLADLGFDAELVATKVGRFARSFLDTYAAGRDADEGWLDKSPRYAEAPLGLRKLFPEAIFVIMHRHPFDQIHSFTKGGHFVHPAIAPSRTGKEAVLRAADYWAAVTRGLIHFAEGREDSLTITYESMCNHPREVLGLVVNHLGLDWSESVLNYHEHEHDLGREAGRVSGTVGFSLASGGWHDWPQGWADDVWQRVASEAETLGYQRTGVLV